MSSGFSAVSARLAFCDHFHGMFSLLLILIYLPGRSVSAETISAAKILELHNKYADTLHSTYSFIGEALKLENFDKFWTPTVVTENIRIFYMTKNFQGWMNLAETDIGLRGKIDRPKKFKLWLHGYNFFNFGTRLSDQEFMKLAKVYAASESEKEGDDWLHLFVDYTETVSGSYVESCLAVDLVTNLIFSFLVDLKNSNVVQAYGNVIIGYSLGGQAAYRLAVLMECAFCSTLVISVDPAKPLWDKSVLCLKPMSAGNKLVVIHTQLAVPSFPLLELAITRNVGNADFFVDPTPMLTSYMPDVIESHLAAWPIFIVMVDRPDCFFYWKATEDSTKRIKAPGFLNFEGTVRAELKPGRLDCLLKLMKIPLPINIYS